MSRLNYEDILTIYKNMSLEYQATQIAGMMHIVFFIIIKIRSRSPFILRFVSVEKRFETINNYIT
ncbi:MAG: hypothetical protein WCS48_02965 [Candidatus Izemoplasmatales bacterium]